MAFLDPYAIDGATITAGQLRRQVYATTKGATGVDGPGDLAVVAVPGSPGVAGIMPGGGVIAVESRRESYSVTSPVMDGDALVAVPTAGSSGATHYVIVEVTDPEYHGQEAEAGATPLVVSSMSGRSRPFLPLARIELEPGETFGVTSTVVDLRTLAMTRTEPFSGVAYPGARHELGPLFETVGEIDVPVPEWATHATLTAIFTGMAVSFGIAGGDVAVTFAGVAPPSWQYTSYKAEAPDSSSSSRFTAANAATIPVAEHRRGTTQAMHFRARQTISENSGLAIVDAGSVLAVQILFSERAV